MWAWVVRICVAALALIGGIAFVSASALWLAARPILEQADTNYAALPARARCGAREPYPPAYPGSPWAIQGQHDIELSVYRDSCEAAGLDAGCYYMSGGPRWLGFLAYRSVYLSQCEMRALNLHGDTPLSAALQRLYPDRDPGALTEAEISCVSLAARVGVGLVCRRDATCCADSGVAPTAEMPR